MKNYINKLTNKPQKLLAMSFFLAIMLGTILLMLPISSQDGSILNFFDALFTATSATCVTGLTVVNTSTYFSFFGKLVIILLIQIGGLGTMTILYWILSMLNLRIGLSSRNLIREQLSYSSMTGVVRLIKYVVLVSFAIELVGAFFLSCVFVPEFGFVKGILYGVFHSISAFCNAGFDILGDSIRPYNTNVIVNFTIMILISLGGLGFMVYIEIFKKKRFRRLNVHTKMVLSVSLLLFLSGFFSFLILEYHNPHTIAGMKFQDKLMVSSFQSVTLRTAGFYSIDFSKIKDATSFSMIPLMFIGGSPASTAGGIKTTTFGVLLFAAFSYMRGNDYPHVFKKTISRDVVFKSLTIFVMAIFLVTGVSFIIEVAEHEKFKFLDVLFETVSAFGTVGISKGITPDLSLPSKLLVTMTMFLGRVGPISLAMGIIGRKEKSKINYAEGKILVG
ncbi:TrkH family potassium uptake protein [Peptoniphilus sp. GNH]|nr:TrkH family potassium uptake protein [Peptoniphilus sp. GNH]